MRNTTKKSFCCGELKKRELSDRIIECSCGIHIKRDVGSGGKILENFLRYKEEYAMKITDAKKIYGFLSKTTSMYEEIWLNELDLLRKKAPSSRIKDGGLAAIPKRFKCRKD